MTSWTDGWDDFMAEHGNAVIIHQAFPRNDQPKHERQILSALHIGYPDGADLEAHAKEARRAVGAWLEFLAKRVTEAA